MLVNLALPDSSFSKWANPKLKMGTSRNLFGLNLQRAFDYT